MKILESEEKRYAGTGTTGGNTTDLTKYRKKEKKKIRYRNLIKLAAVLVLVLAGVFVWLNAETIFEPLRGIASQVDTKTSYDAGFPIELPASSSYSFDKMGEGFTLLTDTYLYMYDTDGAQVYALKHGYSNPEQSVSDKRILIYDKAGYKFGVYSRTSLLYQKSTDDKIVYASVGSDNLAAVVTRSERYSNILYVYDDGGNWKYTRKFADENVMQAAFTGDGEHLIVSTLSSMNGDIIANFYNLSIRDPDGIVWKYTLRNNSLPCRLYADEKNVISVCDNIVISLKSDDGILNGSCPYSGKLRDAVITSDNVLLHYEDISTNKHTALLLSSSAEAVTLATISAGTVDMTVDGSGIYILDGTKLHIYDNMLTEDTGVAVANEGYTDFAKVGRNVILMGYRNIDKIGLSSGESESSD